MLLTQAILEVEGPVPGDQPAVVDLDREARRAPAYLGRVVELEATTALGRRRSLGDHGGDEPVQLRGWDPLGRAVGERERLDQERGYPAAAQSRAGTNRRAQAQLAPDPGPRVVEVGAGNVPL